MVTVQNFFNWCIINNTHNIAAFEELFPKYINLNFTGKSIENLNCFAILYLKIKKKKFCVIRNIVISFQFPVGLMKIIFRDHIIENRYSLFFLKWKSNFALK